MADIIEIIKDYMHEMHLEDIDLTKKEHQDDIYNIIKIRLSPPTTIDEEIALRRTFDACMISLIKKHLEDINAQLLTLNAIETHEQRTPGWYEQRMKLISASDSKNACGNSESEYYKKLVLKKLGIEESINGSADAMIHGTMYEIVSQRIYETRFGVTLREYGCITHSTHSFIGASPDGIVNSAIDMNNLEQISRLGRMLEIKNPYSRIIDDTIKPEYAYQIQQQLEVCNLELCDFLETNIRSAIRKTKPRTREVSVTPIYESFLAFMQDSLIIEDGAAQQNYGIPIGNHSKDGQERGILLQFKNTTNIGRSHLSVLYPIEIPYVEVEICEWKTRVIAEMQSKGFELEITHYWKLLVFDVKTVPRDRDMWLKKILPGLTKFWREVERCRAMSQPELLERFKGLIELERPPQTARNVVPTNTYRFSDESGELPSPSPSPSPLPSGKIVLVKKRARGFDYDPSAESTVKQSDVFRFSDE
jgi:putative phage-type endonuclease